MTEAIFSKPLKAGAKMYFFDVKQAQNGQKSKFIQITESWIKGDQKHRSSLTIFPDQLEAFSQAFEEVKAKAN